MMIVPGNDTAILVFARTPEEEARYKLLHSNADYGLSILRQLESNTLSVAQDSGLPIVRIDESKQEGLRFGERLSNAFQEVFSRGFDKVIAIGADCPDISSEDLLHAQRNTSTSSISIGQDQKQGVYLIGIEKSCFDPKSFQALDWQTTKLAESLVSYASKVGTWTHFLQEHFDLNNSDDVLRYATESSGLYHILKTVFQRETSTYTQSETHFYSALFSYRLGQRGPPLF